MENKLAILEKKVAKKEEIEGILNNKLHQHRFNAPGMVGVAKQMKKCAIKAAEDAEAILQYGSILEGMERDQAAEGEMCGHVSE